MEEIKEKNIKLSDDDLNNNYDRFIYIIPHILDNLDNSATKNNIDFIYNDFIKSEFIKLFFNPEFPFKESISIDKNCKELIKWLNESLEIVIKNNQENLKSDIILFDFINDLKQIDEDKLNKFIWEFINYIYNLENYKKEKN